MKNLLRLLGLMVAGLAIMHGSGNQEDRIIFASLFVMAGLMLALITDNFWDIIAAVLIGTSGGVFILSEDVRDLLWLAAGGCLLMGFAYIKDHPTRPTWKGSEAYHLTIGVLFALSYFTNNPLLPIAAGLCIFIFGGMRLWNYLGE